MEKNRIFSWTCCNICNQKGRMHEISKETCFLPFGFFLELLLYSNSFIASTICDHSEEYTSFYSSSESTSLSPDPPSLFLSRFFVLHDTAIRFQVLRTQLYELRPPKLISNTLKNIFDDDIKARKLLKSEIEDFYTGLKENLEWLISMIQREPSNFPSTTKVKHLIEIIDFYQLEEENTLIALDCCKSEKMNDIRLMLARNSESSIGEIKKYYKEEMKWGLPSKKGIHIFPDSHLLIRESEPSSIISFVLR